MLDITVNEVMVIYGLGLTIGIAIGLALGWAWRKPVESRKPVKA